jgi:hypothetical protein
MIVAHPFSKGAEQPSCAYISHIAIQYIGSSLRFWRFLQRIKYIFVDEKVLVLGYTFTNPSIEHLIRKESETC